MQVLAEYEKRRDKFFKEFDFVLADILTSCFANFAAVWASCPTMRPAIAGSADAASKGMFASLGRFMNSCPSNAFQRVVAPATHYSLAQRGAALIKPMPQLFVIGFGACAAGYGLTSLMSHIRLALDPTMVKNTEDAPIFKSSLAIGAFLAVSSNLRYQIIAGGIEQRFLDVALASKPAVSNACSFVLRTANLYLGASMIVDWLRIVGVQHSAQDEEPVAVIAVWILKKHHE
ncbi:hypothetical protein JKP88DRAFT_316729 [Tribonema minus]|uniref:Uncharacterized protein n=1 Tax=Tribonema minus TaxID=303371 RepID=A0A836CF64_9STRA|nr:hypothetical protein JKP88DRAFT_316729 [Tribonema minus]